MTITYDPRFPADLRRIVDAHLERWAGLIPTWCQEFTVRYEPSYDRRMAGRINYRNRWAELIVTGQWFDDDPGERECSLVHELIHVALEPLVDPVGRIIEDVTAEDTP
ncbi:MAG: hypothetical protein ACODAA_07370, partial [Gemmatimonadota bacterium]